MLFNTRNTVILRSLVLALLIVAMLGPWFFDFLNVPAQYPCAKPSVRLYGDFCGYPMSGFGAIAWFSSGFFYLLSELARGNIATVVPDLIILLFVCIILLPFPSTVLVLPKKISRRMQILNLIIWGLACLLSLTLFVLQFQREQFFYLLWGLLLYVSVAIGTVTFEVFAFRSSTRASQTM